MRRRLARIVRRLRTLRPGHIHLQPEVTQRRRVLIPRQAKVTAVVVVIEVAGAEEVTEAEAAVVAVEVAVEVLTAVELPLTRAIKFSAKNEKARLDLTAGLSRFELHVFKILPNSKLDTRKCLALFLRSDSVLILLVASIASLRQNLAHNSFHRRVLDEVEHSIPGILCFDMQK